MVLHQIPDSNAASLPDLRRVRCYMTHVGQHHRIDRLPIEEQLGHWNPPSSILNLPSMLPVELSFLYILYKVLGIENVGATRVVAKT